MFTFTNTVKMEENGSAVMHLPGTGEVPFGPPPEFGGSEGVLSPEEMFVISVNGCLMMSLRYFARKLKVSVLSCKSEATGSLEKGDKGFIFTNIDVKAEAVVFEAPDVETVKRLEELSEKYCPVSRSLNCPVQYKLLVKTQDA